MDQKDEGDVLWGKNAQDLQQFCEEWQRGQQAAATQPQTGMALAQQHGRTIAERQKQDCARLEANMAEWHRKEQLTIMAAGGPWRQGESYGHYLARLKPIRAQNEVAGDAQRPLVNESYYAYVARMETVGVFDREKLCEQYHRMPREEWNRRAGEEAAADAKARVDADLDAAARNRFQYAVDCVRNAGEINRVPPPTDWAIAVCLTDKTGTVAFKDGARSRSMSLAELRELLFPTAEAPTQRVKKPTAAQQSEGETLMRALRTMG